MRAGGYQFGQGFKSFFTPTAMGGGGGFSGGASPNPLNPVGIGAGVATNLVSQIPGIKDSPVGSGLVGGAQGALAGSAGGPVGAAIGGGLGLVQGLATGGKGGSNPQQQKIGMSAQPVGRVGASSPNIQLPNQSNITPDRRQIAQSMLQGGQYA